MNFKKIFNESLPVEERDDYQSWQKEQNLKAQKSTKDRLIDNKLEKDIKIFFDKFLGLPSEKLKSYSAYNGHIYYDEKKNSYPLFKYYGDGIISVENPLLLEGIIDNVIRKLSKELECCEEAYSEIPRNQTDFTFTLNLEGVNRVQAGPVVGKLKKAGFSIDYIREEKKLKILFKGFDDVEKFNELFTSSGEAISLFEFFYDLA